MNLLTLIAIVVLSAMPTGYRRAGFSLEQGENLLDVNQEQYDLLDADKNLTVSVVTEDSSNETNGKPLTDSVAYTKEMFAKLLAENATLKNQVTALTKLSLGQEETITLLEIEIANPPVITHEDALTDLAGNSIEINGLNVTSAPEELHLFIALLDDLNQKEPLTKKPNCEHLKMTIDGEDITPTAAERDAAWAWYQDNVVVSSLDSATDETGE
jgi:hypothetical protein